MPEDASAVYTGLEGTNSCLVQRQGFIPKLRETNCGDLLLRFQPFHLHGNLPFQGRGNQHHEMFRHFSRLRPCFQRRTHGPERSQYENATEIGQSGPGGTGRRGAIDRCRHRQGGHCRRDILLVCHLAPFDQQLVFTLDQLAHLGAIVT